MKPLSLEDLHRVVTRLPKELRTLLKETPGIFIAGGFIRAMIAGEDPHDIDVFGSTPELAKACSKKLKDTMSGNVSETANAFTLWTKPAPIQFIHKWTFATPLDCMVNFDFTIAQVAVWYELGEWRGECADRFYSDLAARRLYATGRGEPGGSILRLLKFVKRGYSIAPEQLAVVLGGFFSKIRETPFARVVRVISGLLREVDPLRDPEGVL